MASKRKARKGAKPGKAKKAVRTVVKPAVRKAAPSHPVAQAPNPWKAYGAWFAQEAATTLKLLRAFPGEQLAFQPHPRSGAAMQLCWTFVIEQGIVVEAIKGTLKMPPHFPPPPATFAEGISAFERKVAEVKATVAGAKAADYDRQIQFFTGPQQMGMVPAGVIAHLMLCDQIHHRGQLSVYVRMAGGKVPSIYGPSADEPW